MAEHIAALEEHSGQAVRRPDDPLLVSVRSGAAVSMPGMMDTILNLGLNDVAVEGLASATGNARFAYDSYRRLIQMYGEVVDGVDGHRFEQALTDLKAARGATRTSISTADDLRELVETFKRIYETETGAVPAGRARAARGAPSRAVFDSWDSPRAQVYRRTYEIPDDLGTAVNVVQMVFGNKGDELGHGRLLHARPVDRRERALRRVPRKRAGRGRRLRHPHAGADRADVASCSRRRTTQLVETIAQARGALPRHAGHRVHGRGRTLYLLQTRTGEAHCRGRAARGGRDGRRGADLARGGGRADRPGAARPAAPPDDRPGGRRRGRREGPERLTGRGVRGDRASTPTRPRSAARRARA